jgi:molecular chaperone DnaJ
MFRQIQLAYETLGHTEYRQDYDRGVTRTRVTEVHTSVSFEGLDSGMRAEGPLAATFSELFADVFHDAAQQGAAPQRGAALEATAEVSFKDAVRGGQVTLSIMRQQRCATCAGDGRVTRSSVQCPACGGHGDRRWARGHLVFTKPCDACDATGRLTREPCANCRGVGIAPRSEVVTMALPPGMETGARIAVPGRGHAGARGGPAGDLYVTIDVAVHPFFRREGRDLHLLLPVAIHEAALGARVDVPTLDETTVRLRIPAGTPSGHRLRLKGHGVPSPVPDDVDGAGDLVVEIQIVLPPVKDERSRELLREFGRLNTVNVRAQRFGSPQDA